MKQRILMRLKVYRPHPHLKGKEAHHTHQIMGKEIIIMEEGHQVAEVVVAGAHPLAAVQQVEVV